MPYENETGSAAHNSDAEMIEEHLAAKNLLECDRAIFRLFKEISSRKTVLYNEDLIQAAAQLMAARAAYWESIEEEQ